MTASPLLRVEISGRLVGQQDRADRRRRAQRDGDALLLAARELARDSASTRCAMPTRSERRRARAVLRSRGVMPRYVSGSSTFSYTVRIADQVEALEDEADLAVADARPLG